MSSHPLDAHAHAHAHSHDRLQRKYILPQDPGQSPYYFKPLMFPFEWRHLPPLPAILDPFLARVVSGYVRKTCKPDVMELAFDGDGFLHHALTQAIRDACPSRSLSEVNYLHGQMRSNTTFSYLALCYRLIAPNSYHTQKRYADVFEAHIGALYREAKKTGKQGEVEALVAAMFGADVWPVLRDPRGLPNERTKRGTGRAGRAGRAEGRTIPSGIAGSDETDEPVFLHHSRREVIDLTGLEDQEDEEVDPEPAQPRRVAGWSASDVSDDESSDDIDNTADLDDLDNAYDTDDTEQPGHRRAINSAPPDLSTQEAHAQAHTSGSQDPGAASIQPSVPTKQRDRRRGQVGVASQRNDVDRAAIRRAKRANRVAAKARREAREEERASGAGGS